MAGPPARASMLTFAERVNTNHNMMTWMREQQFVKLLSCLRAGRQTMPEACVYRQLSETSKAVTIWQDTQQRH